MRNRAKTIDGGDKDYRTLDIRFCTRMCTRPVQVVRFRRVQNAPAHDEKVY